MQKEMYEKIKDSVSKLKVKEMHLISSYEEGYIGKKVYKVVLEDGTEKFCEQIIKNKENGDAVVIIPVTSDNKYVMIVESRPNVNGGVAIEFPAGMVDKGEDKVVAARRELLEETGYEADNIEVLEWHYQDQGCSRAVITTYVATGCRKVKEQKLDKYEKIDVIEMTYDEMLEVVKSSDSLVRDANTKIAFMEYTLKRKGVL